MEEEIARTRVREAELVDKWRTEEEERAAREESAAKVAREKSLTKALLEPY